MNNKIIIISNNKINQLTAVSVKNVSPEQDLAIHTNCFIDFKNFKVFWVFISYNEALCDIFWGALSLSEPCLTEP